MYRNSNNNKQNVFFHCLKSVIAGSTLSLIIPFVGALEANAASLISAESKAQRENIQLGGIVQTIVSNSLSESGEQLTAEIKPLYVTVDNPPNNHLVSAGGIYEGVGDLIVNSTAGSFRCTASLLNGGMHLLTAAHCLTDNSGVLNATSATVTFSTTSGNVNFNANQFFVHSGWNGNLSKGNDIAIIKLNSQASSITAYDIYRNNNEVGQVADKVGYGKSGQGNTGATLASGTKRAGENKYDDTHNIVNDALGITGYNSGAVLMYDFDNGLAANDAFDFFFENSDLGQGNDEVGSAPGDSGGPSFIGGKIAGISSYGMRLEYGSLLSDSSDVDLNLNSSFGEFGADTRVSAYANWIDNIIAGGNGGDGGNGGNATTPEASTVIGLASLGLGMLLKKKRSA